MATRSSNLAWRIPWTEKPCGLQSMRLQRVRQDLATKLPVLFLKKKKKGGGGGCTVLGKIPLRMVTLLSKIFVEGSF